MIRRKAIQRKVDGVLLLDKPSNMTSNGALQHTKRLFLAKKAGHTGSLDRLATGLLPICFGQATKFSQYLLNAQKRYLVTCQLGMTTDTGDAEGTVLVKKLVPALKIAKVERVLSGFLGEIKQIPPMYSALKQNGQRLYKLARQGIEIERPARSIYIQRIKLCRLDGDKLDLDISCSKGTYIRTLVEDIGCKLGCGAYVYTLRRIEVGPFTAKDMIKARQIDKVRLDFNKLDALLLPTDSMLMEMKKLLLSTVHIHHFRQGQPIPVPKGTESSWFRLYSKNDVFIGIGEVLENGNITPRRLFFSPSK